MINHKCQNCGAQLKKQKNGMYYCEYCRHSYDDDSVENAYKIASVQIKAAVKDAFDKALLKDRLERIAIARQNLYIARKREFISNEELKKWSNEIRKYNPYDVQANFFMLASDKRFGELNKYLRKINAKDNIHLLIGFVQYLTNGQFVEKCILTINDMISSSIPETSPAYKQIHGVIAKSAKQFNSGIFDETLPRDVFVAYSSKDKEKAYELVEYLEERGIKCFISMRNLPKGVDAELLYNERLKRAMDNCQIFLFVSSKNSRSKVCDAYSLEMEYIREKDISRSGNDNYYRNNYQRLIENYREQCKPRVEYLIEEYGTNIYEDQVKNFFSGLSWCIDKESVLRVVKDYLLVKPQVSISQKPVTVSKPQAVTPTQKYQQVQSSPISDFEIKNGLLVKYKGAGGKVVIPNSVTVIGEFAFDRCDSLASVVIPDSVISIGLSAFSYCNSLTSVVIGDSVTTIGEYAFSNCRSLTSVVIPNSVTSIGNSAFCGCRSLEEILIPDSVIEIGSTAFIGCRSLTSVVIPDSVTSIGKHAFCDCHSLTSVVIPDSVTSIGGDAFSGCSKLTSVFIPNSVTSIGGYAFSGCSSLTSVVVPNSVTSIGGYAFSHCDSLMSVVINGGSIGNYAFAYCDSLTSVVIGDSVTSIGDRAFDSCDSLTSVVIPNSVTSIGDNAFYHCYSLEEILIPKSVTSIGEDAFSSCNKLVIYCELESEPSGWKSSWNGGRTVVYGGRRQNVVRENQQPQIGKEVKLKEGIRELNGVMFQNADMKVLTLPASLESINGCVFENCPNLEKIVCAKNGRLRSIDGKAFNNCPNLKIIEFPVVGEVHVNGKAFENCPDLEQIIGRYSHNGMAFKNSFKIFID